MEFKKIVKCKYCGKKFVARKCQLRKGLSKYCSLKCFSSMRKRQKIIECNFCGKKFTILISIIKRKRGKYCSKKCYYLGRKKQNLRKVECKTCGKIFKTIFSEVRRGGAKYCSVKCYGISNRGENNSCHKINRKGKNSPSWKGGITPLHFLIRDLDEYHEWRKSVFLRDNFTCQECFRTKIYLEAHHIKDFHFILQEFLQTFDQFSPLEDKETLVRLATKYEPFWNVDNGKTLCKKCHNLTKKGNHQYDSITSKR